jgi:ApaG protein
MPRYSFSVSVDPRYLPEHSDPAHGVFAFAYTVTITNDGDVAAQLIARHWIITDDRGRSEEVKGLGVVGQQPLLQPGQGFEYTSWTRLPSYMGSMRGSFFCVAEDGTRFDVPIAEFVLIGFPYTTDAPADDDETPTEPPRTLH